MAEWGKFNSSYYADPAILAAGRVARDLHFAAIQYATRAETDGFIPEEMLGQLDPFSKLREAKIAMEKLVHLELCNAVTGGWTLRNFHKYQTTHADLEKRRESVRKRVWEHRERKRNAVTDDESNGVTDFDVTQQEESREEKRPKDVAVKQIWNGSGGDEELRERARLALEPLHLTQNQKSEAWRAFQSFPAGVERIAVAAMSGRVPAALFMAKLDSGEHEDEQHVPQPRRTGYRFVRGSHGGSFVDDPEGTDTPPPGYFSAPGGSRRREETELEPLSYKAWK